MPSAPRIKYAVLTALLIGAGLLVRSLLPGFPHVVTKYAGSILWGSMVYAVISCIAPRWRLPRTALIASVIAISVEFSQLLHTPALDAFRAHHIRGVTDRPFLFVVGYRRIPDRDRGGMCV